MKQEVLLEIKDLNKSFGPTRANRNVSLTFAAARYAESRGKTAAEKAP